MECDRNSPGHRRSTEGRMGVATRLDGTQRALILNYAGLGNGVLALPLLKRLEKAAPHLKYFHTDNPVFDEPELLRRAELKNLLGVTPPLWRRMRPMDWHDIARFLAKQRIDLVINLRIEGQQDCDYHAFKRRPESVALEFWEPRPALGDAHSHVSRLHARLFEAHGLDVGDFDPIWLRDQLPPVVLPPGTPPRIALLTGCTQNSKRWPASKWVELGWRLAVDLPSDVAVFAGPCEDERTFAGEIEMGLRQALGPITFFPAADIATFLDRVRQRSLLVCHDSATVHIGTALGIPTVGLYLSTDARVWGSLSVNFLAVQSRSALVCPYTKQGTGNCLFYYSGCPAGPCKVDVTVERVLQAVRKLLDRTCRGVQPILSAQASGSAPA